MATTKIDDGLRSFEIEIEKKIQERKFQMTFSESNFKRINILALNMEINNWKGNGHGFDMSCKWKNSIFFLSNGNELRYIVFQMYEVCVKFSHRMRIEIEFVDIKIKLKELKS